MQEIYKKLKEFGKVKLNEPLSKHTTFKIGGPADFLVLVDEIKKLIELLKFLEGEGVEYFILGGGSNLLVVDEGFRGVVIKISDQDFKIEDNLVEVCAGCFLSKVAQQTVAAGLTGFEWGVGIPGTIAGAVRGNAAYSGKAMGDIVEKVMAFSNGELVAYTNAECKFSNKESIFKHNTDVILQVWLRLQSAEDNVKSRQEMLEQIRYRAKTQPTGFPSAGCVFKNYVASEEEKAKFKAVTKDERILNILEKYSKVPVGWMVEQVGLKGKQVGGAKVSDQHANFIVNTGEATAQDVLTLIAEIKEKVYDKFGVNIEEEIKIL